MWNILIDHEELIKESQLMMEFKVQPKGYGQGRGQGDIMVEELQVLREKVIVMERQGVHPQETSDDEEEYVEKEQPQGEFDLVLVFKLVVVASSRPRLKALTYDGSLNPEELIDQINALDKCFDYEEVTKKKKVKFVVIKLRGHTSIQWDGVQVDR